MIRGMDMLYDEFHMYLKRMRNNYHVSVSYVPEGVILVYDNKKCDTKVEARYSVNDTFKYNSLDDLVLEFKAKAEEKLGIIDITQEVHDGES